MSPDKLDKIDEIAGELDDATTSVDELQDEPPAGVDSDTLSKMKDALEDATDAADELENQEEK